MKNVLGKWTLYSFEKAMFTFHWSALVVVVILSLMLFFGLAFLMLRRRNEILQDYLTPEEPELEETYFRVRSLPQEASPSEEAAESKTSEPPEGETPKGDSASWGTQASE